MILPSSPRDPHAPELQARCHRSRHVALFRSAPPGNAAHLLIVWLTVAMTWLVAAIPEGIAATGEDNGPVRADVLYHNYCSVCHGDRGDGRSRARASLVPPPRDFTAPEAITDLTTERMIAAVTHGRPGTAMVGWKTQLREPEIAALVGYIQDTFMKPRTSPALVAGREIYVRDCGTCHGANGEGAGSAGPNAHRPVRSFTSPQAASELSRDRMLATVTRGVPGTAMAAFSTRLSAADIDAVVDYIRVAFMMPSLEGHSGTRAHAGRQASGQTAAGQAADMRAPLPMGLKGNRGKGGQFYRANCATCHGAKGDGQGPRAYFINPKPRNFLEPVARSAYNRPALFAAISLGKLGTEMPAWKKVLTDQEIADVAEFVFQNFIRTSEPTSGSR